MNSPQKGNALFLILIAVALFAAVTYAITQTGRGGSSSAGKEQASIDGTRIIDYAGELQAAVTRLTINGCKESQLNFKSSQFNLGNYDNTVTTLTDGSCDIFNPAGGGVSFQKPPASVQALGISDYIITGSIAISGLGTGTTGPTVQASETELMFISLVPKDVCVSMNNHLGIVNNGFSNAGPAGDPPGNGTVNSIGPPYYIYAPPPFTGTFSGGNWHIWGDKTNGIAPWFFQTPAACMAGQPAACTGGVDCNYVFYQVLLAR